MSLAASAEAYARRGWAVLPLWWPAGAGGCGCWQPDCGNPGKHPLGGLVPHGLEDASSDQGRLRGWWRAFPQANVGVRTGAISGLVVLDLDGEAGVESMRALVRRHGRFQATWAQTGSGGWHAYLAHPDGGLPNSAGRLGPRLDVRGDGGYVVAPPSLHASGRRYRWQHKLPGELPSLPAWLLELLRPPLPAAPARRADVDGRGLSPYLAAAVEGEAREVAATPQGQRNERLNLAAWRLGRLLAGAAPLVEATVGEVLLAAARSAGLPEREALATIKSGLRAGRGRPREVAR